MFEDAVIAARAEMLQILREGGFSAVSQQREAVRKRHGLFEGYYLTLDRQLDMTSVDEAEFFP